MVARDQALALEEVVYILPRRANRFGDKGLSEAMLTQCRVEQILYLTRVVAHGEVFPIICLVV